MTENFSPELVNECTRCLCLQSDHCTADCYKVNCEKTWGALELLKAGWVKPPVYIGQPVWVPYAWYNLAKKEIVSELREGKISMLQQKANKSWKFRISALSVFDCTSEDIDTSVFLTEEAGKAALRRVVKSLEDKHGV